MRILKTEITEDPRTWPKNSTFFILYNGNRIEEYFMTSVSAGENKNIIKKKIFLIKDALSNKNYKLMDFPGDFIGKIRIEAIC